MDQLSKQGKWPLAKRPSHTKLVRIFLSKSFWHSHVVKPFAIVAHYPQMVAWLEREDGDDPSDFEVWHLQKSEYGFKELKQWLGNDGTLDKAAKGRMEKAKGKQVVPILRPTNKSRSFKNSLKLHHIFMAFTFSFFFTYQ